MYNIIIRSMKEEDSSEVLEMMKVFYASPALLSDPSEDVMKRDIAINDIIVFIYWQIKRRGLPN